MRVPSARVAYSIAPDGDHVRVYSASACGPAVIASRLPSSSHSLREASCRVIREQSDAAACHLRVGQPQVALPAPLSEEMASHPQGDRKDHEPVFVDQSVRVKRVQELAAAVDQEVLAPGCSFNVSTACATSPLSRVPFHPRGSSRVLEA